MVAYKGHRTYDSEFKLEVLQMIQQDGRTIKSVAEELGTSLRHSRKKELCLNKCVGY